MTHLRQGPGTGDELVPGHRYRIVISDCCVGAELVGVYIGRDGDSQYNPRYRFDIGTIQDGGQVDFEPIDTLKETP